LNSIPQSYDAVLLLDEQGSFISTLPVQLHSNGFKRVFAINDSASVISFMAANPVSVVIYGLCHPVERNFELLREIAALHPDTKILVISGIYDHETVIECMKLGAYDFLTLPLDFDRLVGSIHSCLEKTHPQEMSQRELSPLIPSIHVDFPHVVTRDRKMRSIFRYMEAIAPTSQAVMITGETGSGKELIARALHNISGRSGKFVSVNVAGLDDVMFSDTLFGHTRGAFTGADRERKGLIETAADGTLFLDEIGELSIASQVKLLRLLQESEYYRLGADVVNIATARILVATNSNFEQMIQKGSFRSDLYYRLNSHHISLPPLRERKGDIPLLVDHFVRQASRSLGMQMPSVSADDLDMLNQYDFPGNVRELKGMVSNAVIVAANGAIVLPRLKPSSKLPPVPLIGSDYKCLKLPSGRLPTLKEADEYLIREALRASGGNQRTAAVMLGISRQALNKRLQRDTGFVADI